MNHYTTKQIREAVIAELKEQYQPVQNIFGERQSKEFLRVLDAAFKRLPDRLPDGTLAAKCGKCEMLGDAAPCDECYRNGNYR